MNAVKWLELRCRAFVLGNVLAALPDDLPNMRELRIQSAKLQRMLNEPPMMRTLQKILAGGSSKKLRKEQGRHAAKIGQQIRKVNTMAEKSFKGWLRQRGKSNKQFRDWKAQFDIAVDQSAKRFQKQVLDKVAQLTFYGEGKA